MAELTHSSIQDGWFREISDTMWPGQAMALRCKQILHVEKSKYQDVSVLEKLPADSLPLTLLDCSKSIDF